MSAANTQGSAGVPRANASPARTDGVRAIADLLFNYPVPGQIHQAKRLFQRDAETSTQDACATRSLCKYAGYR